MNKAKTLKRRLGNSKPFLRVAWDTDDIPDPVCINPNLSNGKFFPSVKPYRQAQNKLAKLQRQLSRKIKHSSNWYKAVIKLAKQHGPVAYFVCVALREMISGNQVRNENKIKPEKINYAQEISQAQTTNFWSYLITA